jgi:hypothetical protein
MKGLILGAIVGGIAAIYWRDGLEQIRRGTRDAVASSVRHRLADVLDSAEDAVGEGLDRTRAAACSTLRSWSQTLREPETRDALSPQLSK